MGRQRDTSIDIMKGIGVILVILGHMSLTPRIIKIWLYSFHMPLFFICSGLVFSLEHYGSFRKFLRAKIKQIVIPYFILGILLWILSNLQKYVSAMIFSKDTSIIWNPSRMLISLILGYRLHKYYFSMWFLCTIFLGELCFYFIAKCAKDKWYVYALIVVLSVFFQKLLFKYIQGYYWSIDLLPVSIGFLSCGYLCKLFNKFRKFYSSFYLFLPVSVLNLIFMRLNYHVCGLTDLYACVIGNPLYYLIAAVFGSWSILIFSHKLNYLKTVEFFGRNSLVVYIFQNSFAIPSANDIAKYLGYENKLFTDKTFQFIFVLLVSLIISYILIVVIKWSKFVIQNNRKKLLFCN